MVLCICPSVCLSVCTSRAAPWTRRVDRSSRGDFHFGEGQKDPKTKADITTSRDVGTVRGRRSLHASRHRPDGTGLSSPIDPAYAVCVPTDRPPCHLHPSSCLMGRRARLLADSVPYHCHRRNMSSSSRAHSHTCYECARQAELMLRRWRWYRTLPASHDHVQDGADGRGMSTCRRAG